MEMMEEHPPKKHRTKKRLFFFLLFLGALFLAVLYAPIFRVQQIEVAGNQYLPTADVRRIAGIWQGENVFVVHTDEAAGRLKKDLRIEQAVVTRFFPNGIRIEIKESEPLATIACEYGYLDLNRQGQVLDAYRTLKKMPIPMITGFHVQDLFIGDTVDSEDLKNVLTYLDQLDSASRNQISEVSMADLNHVCAYTTTAVQIRLGTLDRLEEKAGLTKSFLLDLKSTHRPVEYVDFTYTSPSIKFK